jgi:hypothetical protein
MISAPGLRDNSSLFRSYGTRNKINAIWLYSFAATAKDGIFGFKNERANSHRQIAKSDRINAFEMVGFRESVLKWPGWLNGSFVSASRGMVT